MGLKLKESDTHVDAYSDRYRDAGSIPAASNLNVWVFAGNKRSFFLLKSPFRRVVVRSQETQAQGILPYRMRLLTTVF